MHIILPKFITNVKRTRRGAIIAGLLLFGGLIVGLPGISYYLTFRDIKLQVQNIKNDFKLAKISGEKQDFGNLKQDLRNIQSDLDHINNDLSKFKLAGFLSFTKKEFQAAKNLTKTASIVVQYSQQLTAIAGETYDNLGLTGKTYKDLKLAKLTSDQKGNILVVLREATPIIKKIKLELDGTQDDVAVLLNSPLLKYFKPKKIDQIKSFYGIKPTLDLAIASLDYAPELIGYFDQANYLFLLQNNTELRPTGGFIGTYGFLQLKDASLQKFVVDDVYNLDKTVQDTLFITPPEPLTKWNNTTQWFLRDANWSPDFPTSAKQVEWFYNQESGNNFDFTGVFAITPEIISDVIGLFGDITVHNIKFTKDNFVETLEERVEVGFKDLKIPLAERKVIMSDLAVELQKRLTHLSAEQFFKLLTIIQNRLKEKHILLFFNNSDLQKLISAKNWTGEIRPNSSDYLAVVDANLGSLKTDAVMDRSLNYEVKKEVINNKDELVANVILTYTNNGKFTWHSTRYRTYTRIYTPLNSELIKVDGAMANDRTLKIGEPTIINELNKTVFGAFISIEPKETKTLTFIYKLPDYVKNQLENGNYSLLLQKQAGLLNYPVKLKVNDKVEKFNLKTDLVWR